MNNPDIRRWVILMGIGLCAYWMVHAWVGYQRDKNSDDYTGTPAPSIETNGGIEDATVPTDLVNNEGSAETADEGDVPDASLVTPQQETGSTTTTSIDRDLIQVTTPLLQIWIDPLGGDVVGANLPEYPVSLKNPEIPTTLLTKGNGRTYIAQSGLIESKGQNRLPARPVFTSDARNYELGADATEDTLDVVLTFEHDGIQVLKTFIFHKDRYDLQVRYDVQNRSTQSYSAGFYAHISRDEGPPQGVKTGFFRPPAYLGGAVTTPEKRYKRLKFKQLRKDDFEYRGVRGGWIAFLQHYFISAWIPPKEGQHNFYAQQRSSGNFWYGFTSTEQTVAPGSNGIYQATFYVGPKRQKNLAPLADYLSLTVDYGFFWWLSSPMFMVMEWIQSWAVNWGISIILLTIIIKTILFPLSEMSYRSMARMRKLTPQIKRIQEKFGTDRQKMGQEMMALYRKEKANPLSGCFPMLLQMPVFFALYWVLIESVELRQAPLMLWIQDLGAMDPWFILPILNGASMFLMQRLNPPMADPMQQRVMMIMPIMFCVICIFMPAGLVLYWFTNNLYSMGHHYFALKKAGAT
ncbi:MAG: membrane protein insertase YidC [Gammaproteobacteria bacterium]|nr:membrane protein insertase YidC [Gammaproteobacteria bacterium]